MLFDWPHDQAWVPMSGRLRLQPVDQISASPYTGALKAVNRALIWRADFTWNNHGLVLGIDMEGFIDAMEGSVHPVRIFDWWRQAPALLSSGNYGFTDGSFFSDGTGFSDGYAPLVLANSVKGQRQVAIYGLPASQECFTRGDLIGIGGFLYQLRAGVSSNAAGQALLNLLPGLRAGVAADDAVILWRPTCTMRLAPGFEGITRSFNVSEGFTLPFVEDIP